VKLLIVYLGKKVPGYVYENLEYIISTFPSYQTVFLSDRVENLERARKIGAEIFLVTNPELTWSINRSSLSHDPEFRDGFWYRTLARFYSISEYMKINPEIPILQIEADVLILPTIPLEKISKISKSLAFPLASRSHGVASTLFVRDYESVMHFVRFAESVTAANPGSTDTTILAEYLEHFPNRTLVLPSAPKNADVFHQTSSVLEIELLSRHHEIFEGIFDASTWGQYLTGEHEINSWGIRPYFHIQRHHPINPDVFSFDFSKGVLTVRHEGTLTSIYSLHIHSKDPKLFRQLENFDYLSSLIAFQPLGPKTRIIPFVWLAMLPSRLKHTLLGRLSKVVK